MIVQQKHVMNWLSLFVDMYNRESVEKIVKVKSPSQHANLYNVLPSKRISSYS